MRKFCSHIAVFLTLLLGLSLLPYNALHQHQEDEHLAALMATTPNTHSCEFDVQDCQGEFTHTCEHDQHLSKKSTHCFSCQFHFIKGYVNFETNSSIGHNLVSFLHESNQTKVIGRTLLYIGNKGPPQV